MADEFDLSTLEEQGIDNSVIQQMRDAIDKANKRAEKAEKDAAAERKAREDRELAAREANAVALFEKAELPPAQVKWFLTENPQGDVTEELVQTYAQTYGLAPAPKPPEPTPPPTTFAAPTPANGQVPVAARLEYEEYVKEVTSGDAARVARAMEMSRAGLVNR